MFGKKSTVYTGQMNS